MAQKNNDRNENPRKILNHPKRNIHERIRKIVDNANIKEILENLSRPTVTWFSVITSRNLSSEYTIIWTVIIWVFHLNVIVPLQQHLTYYRLIYRPTLFVTIIINSLKVFPISVSWGSFTEVWVTASLPTSPRPSFPKENSSTGHKIKSCFSPTAFFFSSFNFNLIKVHVYATF